MDLLHTYLFEFQPDFFFLFYERVFRNYELKLILFKFLTAVQKVNIKANLKNPLVVYN